MSSDAAVETPAPRRKTRWWLPLGVGVLVVAAWGGIWAYPDETLDVGSRRMFTIMSGFLGLALMLLWLWLLSGLGWKLRLGSFLLVVVVAGAAVASVRRVNFTGDMQPTFVFRWQTTGDTLLDQHLRAAAGNNEPLPPIDLAVGPLDILEYRGASRDGVTNGPALARDWADESPTAIWRQPVGGGYGAFIVVGNCAYSLEQRHGEECVVCYDTASGRQRWVHGYAERFSEALGGVGPRATPTFYQGHVYSLGAGGRLVCLNAESGEPVWKQNMLELAGGDNLRWGQSGSPLVVDDRVYIACGPETAPPAKGSVMAVDATTGDLIWASGDYKGGYASPVIVDLAGTRQLLVFEGVGMTAYNPDDGAQLWHFPWTSDFDINAAQPLVVDEYHVLITSNKGAALLHVAQADGQWSAEAKWRNNRLKAHYACVVMHEGYVYGLDVGILTCLDLETGKPAWKGGRYGHGQMLLRDDLLIVLSESGELALVAATPDSHQELGRIQAIEGKTWNNPTLVGDRIFIRNDLEMACYELPLAAAFE